MGPDPSKYPALCEKGREPEKPRHVSEIGGEGAFATDLKSLATVLRVLRRRKIFRLLVLAVVLVLVGKPVFRAVFASPSWVFEPEARAILVDGEDRALLTWPDYGDRRPVEFDDLPEDLVNAVLAREDQRFWSHWGVDVKGMARAAMIDLQRRSLAQGGSTVTMQLVERVYEFPQESNLQKLQAKLFELLMAPKVEAYAAWKSDSREEGKQRLMAAYLSRVGFGHRTVGIREAAHCYFGKEPRALSLGESAYLVGLIRGPSVNNAYSSQENARRARNAVIENMKRLGLVDPNRKDKVSFYVSSQPHRKERVGDGFLSAAVRRKMEELVKAGEIPEDYLQANRVKIYLGCDSALQESAHRALLSRLSQIESDSRFRGARGDLQGGVVAVDNHSGAIICSVGGRDFDRLSYDCALQGHRTVASAGKPFIFAALMEQSGSTAQTTLANTPLVAGRETDIPGPLDPRETSALESGTHPLWKGLAHSSNRMAMRAGSLLSWNEWNRLLQDVGLTEKPLTPHTTRWLGSYSARPVDLAGAYAVFPRGGFYTEPYLIRKVEIGGRTVFRRRPRPDRILSSDTCDEITASLREVLRQGTASGYGGRAFAEKHAVAGKTGTSDGVSDAWFVGYSSDITLVVWIGFPEGNRTILKNETGGTLAFPVWKAIMEKLPAGYEFHKLPELESGRGRTLAGR